MKILSWNIACLPNYCNIFSNPIDRIPRILSIIEKHDADIICLQEVFDKKIRKIIIEYFKDKYNYYYTVNYSPFLNDGLLTMTRYEMINKKNYVFEYTCGEDYLVYKGFHFIIVRYGNDEENKDNFISIINTHMNADPLVKIKDDPKLVRTEQLKKIIQTIKENKINKNLFCGDTNIKFENVNRLFFLNTLKIYNKHMNTNIEKIKTFENDQLDYIIYYGSVKLNKYEIQSEIIVNESDHHLLICDIDF